MKLTNILIITILVLILYIILIPVCNCSVNRRLGRESYLELEQPLEWKVYNQKFNRKLYFLPPNSKALASFRGIMPQYQNITATPKGFCTSVNTPSSVNSSSQSLVSETSLTYTLTSACIPIKASSLSGDKLNILFEDVYDWMNYAYLIMSDPLYVEFNSTNETQTIAYYIKPSHWLDSSKQFVITNNGPNKYTSEPSYINKTAQLRLKPVQTAKEPAQYSASEDEASLFSYPSNKTIDKLTIKSSELLNARTFYLQAPCTSSDSSSSVISFIANKDGYYKVFDKSYQQVDVNNTQSITEFLRKFPTTVNSGPKSILGFCKKIGNMFKNKDDIPVFTISFDLNLEQENVSKNVQVYRQPIAIFEMSMANDIGFVTCNNNISYKPTSKFYKNGNIVSAALRFMPGSSTTELHVGNTFNGCLFTEDNTTVIELPILPTSTSASAIITISPYNVHTLVYWKDPQKQSPLEWIYSERKLANNNSFASIYSEKIDTRNRLEDIEIKTDTTFVPAVSDVQLGFKNFGVLISEKS